MSAWVALLEQPAGDLSAAAGSHVLAAWLDCVRRPHPQARRVDPQVLDPAGSPAQLSLLWPDRDALPLFDDPAVVAARRSARRLPAPRAVSTLTVDQRHFAGSLWVVDHPGQLADDPFRLLGRPLQLAVAGGVLGRSHPLVGPAQERYAGAPWPAGSFGGGGGGGGGSPRQLDVRTDVDGHGGGR